MMDIGRELSYRMQAGFMGIMVHKLIKSFSWRTWRTAITLQSMAVMLLQFFLSERQPIFYSYRNEEVHL